MTGKNKEKNRMIGSLLLLISLLPWGCSVRLSEYVVQPFDHYPCSDVKKALAIAIQPLTGKKECKRYFGTNLLAMNILPVFVIVENRSHSSSFILSNDRISLTGAAESHDGPVCPKTDTSAGTAVGSAGALLIAPPLMLIGAAMVSNSAEIRHNLQIKQLRTVTLSPGNVAQGFAYFSIPEGGIDPGEWTVNIEVLELHSNNLENFHVPFRWNRSSPFKVVLLCHNLLKEQ